MSGVSLRTSQTRAETHSHAESGALLRRMALPGCAYSCTELAINADLVLQTRPWLRPRLTPITRPDWRRARRRDRDTDRLVLRVSARGDRGDLSRCRWPSLLIAHFGSVAGGAIGWARNMARWATAWCRRCRYPGGLGCSTGSPAARHALKPPSTSVARAKPSCCSVAAARLDWQPSSQSRMICSSSCGAQGWWC